MPKRGDIIVFHSNNKNEDKIYIKRLIGLPHDKIKLFKGVIYINGQAVNRKEISEYFDFDQDGAKKSYKKWRETLDNGVHYEVIERFTSDLDFPHSTSEYHVPTGHFFVMGDNRSGSIDSRFLEIIGFVPEENLIGKALTVLWNNENISQKMKHNKAEVKWRFFKSLQH
jgi:signal peptidase I